MASLSNDKSGKRRTLFSIPGGRRQTLWLGKVPKKSAESMLVRIEEMIQHKSIGSAFPTELVGWIQKLPGPTRKKLESAGLVEARPPVPTVGEVLDRYRKTRVVKDSTMQTYAQALDGLEAALGRDTLIDAVTAAHADEWRRSLTTAGLAAPTIAKRVKVARALFSKAVRWKMIAENPFEHLKSGSQANPKRSHHVPVETIERVIAACPDREWRAIIALCRFAGLRAPSELVGLMWTDVDWKRRALTVRSPKTEHHEGQAQRLVPISDRLREILNDLWTSAGPSESKMLPSIASSTKNLRTRFQKILKRAKVSPWPRLFQNLRASAETDWVERFPQHEVASWLGHSPTVARTHYLQTRDMHFAAAAGLNTDGSSLVGSSDSASGAAHGQRIADCIAPASQYASQRGAAPKSTRSRAVPQMQTARELAPVVADGRESSRAVRVTPEGFEPSLPP